MATKKKKSTPRKTKARTRKPRMLHIDTETHPIEELRMGRIPRRVRVSPARPLEDVRKAAHRIRTAKPVKVSTRTLIESILKAANERWPEDKSKPGIQIAFLPEVQGRMAVDMLPHSRAVLGTVRTPSTPARFYVALHRYEAADGQSRVVSFKTENLDLDLALVDVAKHVSPPAKQRNALADLLSGWIELGDV